MGISLRRLGGRGILRGVRREYRKASRRAARTRGFAAPAFAGCAFIEDATELGAGARPVKHRLQGETTLSYWCDPQLWPFTGQVASCPATHCQRPPRFTHTSV